MGFASTASVTALLLGLSTLTYCMTATNQRVGASAVRLDVPPGWSAVEAGDGVRYVSPDAEMKLYVGSPETLSGGSLGSWFDRALSAFTAGSTVTRVEAPSHDNPLVGYCTRMASGLLEHQGRALSFTYYAAYSGGTVQPIIAIGTPGGVEKHGARARPAVFSYADFRDQPKADPSAANVPSITAAGTWSGRSRHLEETR